MPLKNNKIMPQQVIVVRPNNNDINSDITFRPSFFQQPAGDPLKDTKDEGGDKDEEEKDKGLIPLLRDFAESTTAHGFGHIIGTKSYLLRLIWLVIMLTLYIILFLIVQPLFTKYRMRPVASKEIVIHEDNPLFPVVVICNENMVLKSKYNELLNNINETENSIQPWKALLEIPERKVYGHKINEVIVSCDVHHKHNACLPTTNQTLNSERGWTEFWHYRYNFI